MASSSESEILARLESHGIKMPEKPPAPVASYVASVRTGNLVFVSGQVPKREGQLIHCGIVGKDVSIENAQEAAKWCAVNGLAAVRENIGDLSKISRVVKVGGFVRSESDFQAQPKVINGASDFLLDVLGPQVGRHARAAVGVSSLPLGVSVEIDFIFEVTE
eukprot:CAMPEP_0201482490 /NCGR_PEP_ID=MMETSP0151_2-20130828/6773_1 /ASSEMBLY_ACC=CAM_ASM_000257 /TAXON_ID=200890 /ORGANISM="Paramoeba atlantica, Strain 621/1 / CCAP 1560/9" /LENGTH=161 /DNA_ID=CAMNT_0047865223 /DNA_START=188 /DNA_END=673 /DNA_ORIENTATION=+